MVGGWVRRWRRTGQVLGDHRLDLREPGRTFGLAPVAAAAVEDGEELFVDGDARSGEVSDLGSDARRRSPRGRAVETEEADRVLAEHESELVLRHARERVAQPVGGVRPGSLGVRVVATEEDLLHADVVAHLDLGLVHERRAGQAVGAPIVARPTLGRELVAVAVVERVEMGEHGGQPVGAHLAHDELQVRVAVEHTTEHELPHRSAALDAGEEVGGEHVAGEQHDAVHVAAAALGDLPVDPGHAVVDDALFEAEPGVHDEREAVGLAGGEERLPVRVEERRHVGVAHEARHERADEAVLCDRIELRDRRVHVGARTDARR